MAFRSRHGTNQEVIREVKHHTMNTSRSAGQKSRDSYHEISSRDTHARGNTAQLRRNEDRRYDYSNLTEPLENEGEITEKAKHTLQDTILIGEVDTKHYHRELKAIERLGDTNPTNHKASEGAELYDSDNSRRVPTEKREGTPAPDALISYLFGPWCEGPSIGAWTRLLPSRALLVDLLDRLKVL
ncbi:hypothetical protein F2Q69_00020216 [Brassica cretica]|uniref:Uncharacterized protein n=1 Tax=Brassica cretica TaxID=69181 RepID=A0A8S9QTQ9_BRACR|nr:hypothetical protein F2Q69_00020216 [Brassica cretica]